MSKQQKQPWKKGEWVHVGFDFGGRLAQVFGEIADGDDNALRIHAHRVITHGSDWGPETFDDGGCIDEALMVYTNRIWMVKFLCLPPDWCTCSTGDR